MATDDDAPSSPLERTFAVMLAELEDAATELTKRQQALARELAEVDAELDRVEAVRSAMVGSRSTPKRPGRRAVSTEARKETASLRRVAKIKSHFGESEFTGADVAEFLQVNVQGVGPILAGMVRRGEAEYTEDGHGRRAYRIKDAA